MIYFIQFLVDVMQRQIDSLTKQVATMSQSYEELIDELRERNRNGLIFLPFETLHQKILMEGTFGDGVFAQIIDHPRVTILDKFILADVYISNQKNDHFNIGLVSNILSSTLEFSFSKKSESQAFEHESFGIQLIKVFSDDIDCRANPASSTSSGGLPLGESYHGKNQKAFITFDANQDEDTSFPRWGQWT